MKARHVVCAILVCISLFCLFAAAANLFIKNDVGMALTGVGLAAINALNAFLYMREAS